VPKTTIFYFSGTGNSLWISRLLAQELENTELISMTDRNINQYKFDSSVIGLIFYIPWGGPGSVEEQQERFAAARLKISLIAQMVREHIKKPVEKGPLWQRIVFTWIYNLSFPHVHTMDKSFWVDERCNQCKLCVEICPSQNIVLQDDKLVWQNHCEQCLACIQWCPKESLQYGKKTPAYARYHHPEIKVKDLMK